MKPIQFYEIYLINGSTIRIAEDYDLPFEDGFVSKFMSADETDVLRAQCCTFSGECYIPKKNILFIAEGDVV